MPFKNKNSTLLKHCRAWHHRDMRGDLRGVGEVIHEEAGLKQCVLNDLSTSVKAGQSRVLLMMSYLFFFVKLSQILAHGKLACIPGEDLERVAQLLTPAGEMS